MPTTGQTPLPSAELADWVREVAATQDPRVGRATPVVPLLTHGLPTRPTAPEHSRVYICAGVIVKLHSPAADAGLLARRLRCIGNPDIDRLWIQPLVYSPLEAPDGSVATLWPRVSVLATIDPPPWAAVGALLAKLHRMPIAADPPSLGAPARLARAIEYLRTVAGGAYGWLGELGESLAGQLPTPARITLAHGDFHLGQLGHTPLRRSWKLLDVDDFGVGDPAWDLSRPAGFWAAGLLPDESWKAFLSAYREAGGPAVSATGDPWLSLDLPSRAAMVVAAVQQLRTTHNQDTTELLLAACRRLLA